MFLNSKEKLAAMYDKNYILEVIRSQTREWMLEPRWGLKREEFKWRSYYNESIEEIIREIRDNVTPPEITINIFINRMCHYAIMHPENKDMFVASVEAASNILDFLNALTKEET